VLYDVTTGALLWRMASTRAIRPQRAQRIANFVRRASIREIGFLRPRTTITTNALLEMRGASVGFLTPRATAGPGIQNQARDGNLFDYF